MATANTIQVYTDRPEFTDEEFGRLLRAANRATWQWPSPVERVRPRAWSSPLVLDHPDAPHPVVVAKWYSRAARHPRGEAALSFLERR